MSAKNMVTLAKFAENLSSKQPLCYLLLCTFCLSINIVWLDEYLSWVPKYQSTQVLSLSLIIKLK